MESAAPGWLPGWRLERRRKDTVGLYDPSRSMFMLRNSNTTGIRRRLLRLWRRGRRLAALAGDWNGDGRDHPGLYVLAERVMLRNSNSMGVADARWAMASAGPVGFRWPGDWNHDAQRPSACTIRRGRCSCSATATPPASPRWPLSTGPPGRPASHRGPLDRPEHFRGPPPACRTARRWAPAPSTSPKRPTHTPPARPYSAVEPHRVSRLPDRPSFDRLTDLSPESCRAAGREPADRTHASPSTPRPWTRPICWGNRGRVGAGRLAARPGPRIADCPAEPRNGRRSGRVPLGGCGLRRRSLADLAPGIPVLT